MMTLQTDITENMCQGQTSGAYELTIVLREFNEEDGHYFVAECLDIPGCVSQGETEEEAKKNIELAVQECVSVMIRDCMKHARASRTMPDLTNIKSQRRLTVETMPQLQYA